MPRQIKGCRTAHVPQEIIGDLYSHAAWLPGRRRGCNVNRVPGQSCGRLNKGLGFDCHCLRHQSEWQTLVDPPLAILTTRTSGQENLETTR